MDKGDKMEAHVTKNGYRYYLKRESGQSQITLPPKEQKWEKSLKWLITAFLTGVKNLPGLLMKAGIIMVTTPIMILLFVGNLIKSLIVTAIGWFVFKVISYFIIGFGIAGYSFLVQKDIPAPEWFNNLMTDFVFPHGVPVYYWWETTIIIVLAVITALSLTIHPNDA